jgi:hypothetical protein
MTRLGGSKGAVNSRVQVLMVLNKTQPENVHDSQAEQLPRSVVHRS